MGQNLELKTLTVIRCTCGVTFAIDGDFLAAHRKIGKPFLCPNGCKNIDPRKFDEDNEREKRERAELQLIDEITHRMHLEVVALNEKRQRIAAKGQLKKFKNTCISNNICPCCFRKFRYLARHILSEHPEHDA